MHSPLVCALDSINISSHALDLNHFSRNKTWALIDLLPIGKYIQNRNLIPSFILQGAGCGLMNRVGRFEEIVRGMNTVSRFLPLKAKMQYVHCRLIASYFRFPWRNSAEMSSRSIFFHNLRQQLYQTNENTTF